MLDVGRVPTVLLLDFSTDELFRACLNCSLIATECLARTVREGPRRNRNDRGIVPEVPPSAKKVLTAQFAGGFAFMF
jgi:hypothetical protein